MMPILGIRGTIRPYKMVSHGFFCLRRAFLDPRVEIFVRFDKSLESSLRYF